MSWLRITLGRARDYLRLLTSRIRERESSHPPVSPTAQALFSADRPIRTADEDRLGRSGFSRSLARALSSWKGEDSLVVALYGEWGSGKSSIKNMVLEAVRTSSPPPADLLEFNPWAFGGQGRLMDAFVREVAIALGREATADAEDIEAKWRLYESRFRSSETVAQSVQQLVSALLAVFGASGLAFAFFTDLDVRVYLAVISTLAIAIAAVMNFGAKLVRAAGVLAVARAAANRKTVDQLKVELAELLKKRVRPLLIVIDDVDRLEAVDIRLLFQLVKANADLPNLVYFVLSPREPVERALDRGKEGSGREFLEKIVQVGFDVPLLDRARLEKVLFTGLDEIVLLPGSGFDQRRWTNLYIGGLRPFFDSLRDVQRYLSSLRFHAGLLRSEKVFEVNVVDLIGLETLRLFEPDVYASLAGIKRLLTEPSERDSKGQSKAAIDAVIVKANEIRRESATEILKQMFPALEGILGNHFYGSSFHDTWARERRVCSPDHFDRYFQLGLPETEISEAELHELINVAGERAAAVTALTTIAERGLLPRLLERLEAYKEEIPIESVPAFATALMDVGDLLPNAPRRMFEIEPDMHANRVVYWATKRATKERRREIVRAALADATGLYLPVRYLVLEEDALKKDAENAALTADDVAELKKVASDRIASAAKTPDLSRSAFLDSLLYAWQQWGDASDPKRYVADMVATRDGLLAFLRAFVRQSISQSMGEYATRSRWYIRPSEVEQFVSIDVLGAEISKLDKSGLSDPDERAVEATGEAIERRKAGKPDYDPMTSSMHED